MKAIADWPGWRERQSTAPFRVPLPLRSKAPFRGQAPRGQAPVILGSAITAVGSKTGR